MRALVEAGELVPVLPGVYAPPLTARSRPVMIAALMAYDVDAVLTGAAAASVSFWPKVSCPKVTAAVRGRREPQAGFEFSRRAIPPELVVEQNGLRFTSPALTALDLCDAMGGDGIGPDQALRMRHTNLPHLHQALDLTANRVGNPNRRRLLLDSRDEPWSAAERLLHRLLREADIHGWKANRKVVVDGVDYWPDAVFRKLRLILEVDGREFHSEPDVFESDRWRQNLMVLDGWCVLRFTYAMLVERPAQVLDLIRQALTMQSESTRI